MSQIATILVTASPLALSRLGRALAGEPGVQLCGQAQDLSGAYVLIEQKEPKLVILGPELVRHPDFSGLLAMFRVMAITWMQIASDPPPGPLAGTPAGEAPTLDPGMPAAEMMVRIRAALARPMAGLPKAQVPAAAATVLPGAAPVQKPALAQMQALAPAAALRGRPDRLILIGSSTGGIDALLRVLSVFPADCPPTAIVQHTGAAFSDSLIRLLDRACAASVVPAQNGVSLQPGSIVVGAGCGGHLRLQPGTPPRAQLVPGEPVSGHLPSVDMLFRSATGFAPKVVAALLTGMGRDGAQGMLELRKAGATTIAQDEATSVVYGMPRAAWEIGAAQMRLPLDRIGPELLARCTTPAQSEGVSR